MHPGVLLTPISRRISDDPFQRLALVALIVGSYLRVQENSDRANQPMLPVVPGDDCDALYLLLVIFYESSMIFKGGDILPAVEPGTINQQPDFPIPTDNKNRLAAQFGESRQLSISSVP